MREEPATLRPSEMPTLHEVMGVLDGIRIDMAESEDLGPMFETL